MKWNPSAPEYKYDAASITRSGSLNFSPALKVLSKTARLRRFRIFKRTRVWPPRAVGFETSTSRQWYGAPSYSKYIFRLISIASIRLAIRGLILAACDGQMIGSARIPPMRRVARRDSHERIAPHVCRIDCRGCGRPGRESDAPVGGPVGGLANSGAPFSGSRAPLRLPVLPVARR